MSRHPGLGRADVEGAFALPQTQLFCVASVKAPMVWESDPNCLIVRGWRLAQTGLSSDRFSTMCHASSATSLFPHGLNNFPFARPASLGCLSHIF